MSLFSFYTSGRVRKHDRQPDPGHDRDCVYRLVHPGVLHPPGGRPRQVGLPQGWDEHRGRARHPPLLCHPLLHGPELRDVRNDKKDDYIPRQIISEFLVT